MSDSSRAHAHHAEEPEPGEVIAFPGARGGAQSGRFGEDDDPTVDLPDAEPLPPIEEKDDGQAVEVVDAELVEDTPNAPTAVDTPAVVDDTGSWLEQRRAYLLDAPEVIPSYLRNKQDATDAARWVATYYAHVGAYHATRSPLYLLRLLGRAPRGVARVAGTYARWVADTESRALIREAAGRELRVDLGEGIARRVSGDSQRYLMLTTRHDHRVKARVVLTVLVTLPVLVTVGAVSVATVGAWWSLVGASLVFGLLGGKGAEGRPIITRHVSQHQLRPLDSAEITDALAAIGIKGKVNFAHPIQTDGPGWRAEVDLPAGYLAERVLEDRAKLAAAMRRPLTTVWPEGDADSHPGRMVLWVAKQDPAKAKRRLWPLLKHGQADMFEEVPFGFDPRGRVTELNLMYSNMLIGGVPGSGKTSAVLAIALAAALDPRAELWTYEMKGSGDLDPVRECCHRYVSGDDDEHCEQALDALKALEKELKRRKKVIAELPLEQVPNGRKVYPHLSTDSKLGVHPLVAIFDEAHTLFEHEEYGAEAADIAGRLIRKARAYGIILVFTTQRPDAKSLPRAISDNVSTRFALAVVGQQANDMILGTSMYKNGVRATMFDPRKEAGTGWLSRSAHDNQITRAAFITQEEAVEVGRRARALRVGAGTLGGQAAGEQIEATDTSTILDHLAAVWLDGATAMHSHRLVEALAAYRPDDYGAWVEEADTAARSTLLTNALKPYRVGTRQVTIRECCGGAKGVRWEDVEKARGRDE